VRVPGTLNQNCPACQHFEQGWRVTIVRHRNRVTREKLREIYPKTESEVKRNLQAFACGPSGEEDAGSDPLVPHSRDHRTALGAGAMVKDILQDAKTVAFNEECLTGRTIRILPTSN
jgi:hypothetical protein